jgi:hypothetical protein
MNMLDHFAVSRGLYYGSQKLEIDLEQVSIFKKGMMVEDHIPRENVDSMELGQLLLCYLAIPLNLTHGSASIASSLILTQ